jgi:iron complex outermembrane receptor protein
MSPLYGPPDLSLPTMIHCHAVQAWLLMGACLLGMCDLRAQEPQLPAAPEEEVVELGTVIIEAEREKLPTWTPSLTTATRSSVPLNRVPQSIQVISRELLKEQDAQTLGDALTNVSGVVPVKTYQTLILSPLVRGFSAEVFADGMPGYSTTSSMDTATLVNVQSIEVIKGPTAALFGGGVGSPLGGIINVVSVDPLKEHQYTFGYRTGSWQTRNPFADFNTPLTKDGSLALRITADYEDGTSHIDEVRQKRWSFNPTLRWEITPETILTLRAQFSELEMLEYAGMPAALALSPATQKVAPYAGPSVDPYRYTGSVDSPMSKIRNTRLLATLKHSFSQHLEFNLAAQYYQNSFDEYSTYTFASAQAPLPARPSVYPVLSGYLPSDVTQYTINAWLTGRFELGPTKHELIFGGDIDSTESIAALGYSHLRINLPAPFPPTILASRAGFIDFAVPDSTLPYVQPAIVDRTQNIFHTMGVYLQDHVTAFDRVHVLAGLRLIQLDLDHQYSTDNTLGAPTKYNESYTEIAPRLGAVIDIAGGVSLFGAYSEGYRGVLNYTGKEPPVPESSTMKEGGFKFTYDKLGISGAIAAYQLVRENVPTANPFIPGSTVQVGQQRSQGLEADLAWEPDPSFSFLVAYAYTDARVTEDVPNNVVTAGKQLDRVGKRLARVPEHAGRVAMRYRFQEGMLQGLGIGLGVTMGSKRPVSLTNNYFTDPYYVADAQISYERKVFKAALSISNLTNHFYYEPYPYLGEDVVAPARPITFALTLSYSF